MGKWNVALGFYQHATTANDVLKELKRSGFWRIATVKTENGRHEVKRDHSLFIKISTTVAIFIITLLLLAHVIAFHQPFFDTPNLIGIGLITLLCAIIYWLNSLKIDSETVERFKELVLKDEILILVQVKSHEVRQVLHILRQVESGHPLSFLLRSDLTEHDDGDSELPKEPLTREQLRKQAMELASTLGPIITTGNVGQPLLKKLKNSEKILHDIRYDIAAAEDIEQTVTISGEWFLDNMYVIQGSIEEIQRNLPRKFYRELPKIKSGPFARFPRIYVIAMEMITATAGKLSRESIIEFINSYQAVQPLTIGELWALPLMLRLRLVEWIQLLALHIDRRMREGELASFWGNRLLQAAHREPTRLDVILMEMMDAHKMPSSHFAEELLDHLFDEQTVLPQVRKWLEDCFKQPIAEVIHHEQMQETAEQTTFASAVTSLIALAQLSWQTIFEEVSPVDAILKNDPSKIYMNMDFNTRDQYRHAVEVLAKGAEVLEVDVATHAIQLAQNGNEPFSKHIGYYLIDKGRKALEKDLKYRATPLRKIRSILKSHASQSYLGSIFFLTLIFETILIAISLRIEMSVMETALLAALSLTILSEIAVQCINLIITRILPPTSLPKMSYEKGVPPEYKTLAIVPMMLQTPEAIQQEVDRLEIRYLANIDPQIYFGLFSDFSDSPQFHSAEDNSLLECAVNGIKNLEKKYGPGRFFLFHRQRVWSDSENAWIGWERKRGKLENLNRYLTEGLTENLLYEGQAESLKGVKYVITLDADTQLPKDRAKQLIETLSHPLNQPYLTDNGRGIKRGFTIIQPRVNTDFLNAQNSWFVKIFSDPSSIDPYTQAVSDAYQDLTHEGTYHGKGIYDVHAFHSVLSNRFPDEHLLSHDLIEGAFVRVGFASDICLFDLFPQNYFAWANRQHRWMRGDWQIIDWLFERVPLKNNPKENNSLSVMNRWKIFDNLRRALFPVCAVLLLLCAWLGSAQAYLWTSVVAVALFLPCVFSFLIQTACNPKDIKLLFNDFIMGILRGIVIITQLPHQAWLSIDALARVIYRRTISKKHLLEWGGSNGKRRFNSSYSQLFSLSAIGAAIFLLTLYFNPSAVAIAAPFCILWIATPFLVHKLDKPIRRQPQQLLKETDTQLLRRIARRTWRFFDDFVGPPTHWLPPDNYQTALQVEVAQRTSPTNIGLWFVSLLSAYDFKFITADKLVDNALATTQTLKKLERFQGHFLNWYETSTLDPLYPRYISTVDSGNLLASIWTFQEGLYQLVSESLLPSRPLSGLQVNIEIILQHEVVLHSTAHDILENILSLINKPSSSWIDTISTLKEIAQLLPSMEIHSSDSDAIYWLDKLKNESKSLLEYCERYLSWLNPLAVISKTQLEQIDPHAISWRNQAISWKPSWQELASQQLPLELTNLIQSSQKSETSSEISEWCNTLKSELYNSQLAARDKLSTIHELDTELSRFTEGMDFQYLYSKERKVFAIGYNVDNQRLDNSFYDLLASEARIASLVSIAKGDVPIEHWWALGRPYAYTQRRKALLSWGGTMFEYLMPLLFSKQYSGSLLGDACDTAVYCQIGYGNKRGIPWGISESAYSMIDSRKTYQYRSFGVPGLGLKRGIEDDLVVSPYSSMLALMINAQEAVSNLKRMASTTHASLLGHYGFYESIDFTRQSGPTGERGVVVYAYMAHHQGMSLIAINNLLNRNIMQNRFHQNPRISGVESLLYERIPASPAIAAKYARKEIPLPRLTPFSQVPIMGVINTPDSITPKVNLLSNGNYSVMITNSGGGYSRWRNLDITRWRADTTRDLWGSFCFIKDLHSKTKWSSTYHPTLHKGRHYTVSFKSDKAEFTRRDHQIETITEIVVSPEDNAEIRLITITNLSSKQRHLELTSYVELALAPHMTDRAHPCFNKFFIETEALPEHSGLLAFRRLRSPNESPVWAGHVVAMRPESKEPIQYETDRSKFIGRNRTLQHPAALDGELSNSVGTVLDPIFSLRQRVLLEPGQQIQISFVTIFGESREAVVALLQKYQDLFASHRAIEMAWTYAQLELRHLSIHQEEAQLFQKLASRIIYPHMQLRPSAERLKSNKLSQTGLWAQGISGDLPILVLTIGDIHDTELVKQVLIAHRFWHLRGLQADLVILNEELTTYEHPLLEHLKRMIQVYAYQNQTEGPGGIFLRNSDQIPEEELTLILSAARVILIAARGTLRQQMVSPMPLITYPPNLRIDRRVKDEPSKPLPFLETTHFNGYGGFTKDGKSYVSYLGPNTETPAPWINILANPQFGTLVSEAGMGATWYGNSQSNRITPWSNDPISNPIADTIYIRDEELGVVWTPTPHPIRELDAYRIHHTQGSTRFEHNSHGIEQELLIFVPMDNSGGIPLRIQRIRLKNNSPRLRKLTLTSYSELVLGSDREETQMHVFTEWDAESQSLFARNRYHPYYSKYFAFSSSVPPASSFTADRSEFLGRNNPLSAPAALKRVRLSGHSGPALDPCSALQVSVELQPGETKEIVFILGYSEDEAKARELVLQCRNPTHLEQLYKETHDWWNKSLETITVEVPDEAANFLINRWLPYQNLSCRIWGRTAFYQSSGAYGFRDQLQDVLALVYSQPQLAREHILRAAARQFIEGDVQHWWHPESGGGVRTRITDDLAWLPFATAQYVRTTGDKSILDEVVPFIQAPLLQEDQHELFIVPEISTESGTLLEHCRRAINKAITSGPHGLILMGGGDWNDGMNRVGIKGKGESIWLSWFLIHAMNDFAELLDIVGQNEAANSYRIQAKRLAQTVEEKAWDGEWYLRAYYDDESPLGSHTNVEATIDSLAQSWAIISGAGNTERCETALNSALKYLVNAEENLVLLLTPPFDKTEQDPGYIKGYPPGVRENGGQYTHGSLWLAMAFARKKQGNKAVELLTMMHPITHSQNSEQANKYKIEPYVAAADIYSLPGSVGRGGWTWYSGSAGWMYRIWLEEVLGFKLRGNRLSIDCAIPSHWDGFKINYRYRNSEYKISVENPHHTGHGPCQVELDGVAQPAGEIQLVDDGHPHTVRITLQHS